MSLRGCLAFFVLILPLPIRAATVTWVFEGTIAGTYDSSTVTPVEVPELTSLGVVAGTPFIATFTIELDTPDLDATATRGQYNEAVRGVSFAASGYGFSSSALANGSILVVNVDAQILGAYYGGPGGYFDDPLFGLEVEASEPGVFASDAIPSPFPAISVLEPFTYPSQPDSAFGFGSWLVVVGGPSILVGSLTSHYAVPEPVAAAFAGFGLLALAALRIRRSS